MIHIHLKNIKSYNNLPIKKRTAFKGALEMAEKIVREIYFKHNLSFLKNITINLTTKFYDKYVEKNKMVFINLYAGNTIHFYARLRCRYSTPINGIKVDFKTYVTDVLIHELTHAIQHQINPIRGRYNEVETTNNEIYYLKNYKPKIFDQLILYKKNKYKKNDKVKCKIQFNKKNESAIIISGKVSSGGSRLYTIKLNNGWIIDNVNENDLLGM